MLYTDPFATWSLVAVAPFLNGWPRTPSFTRPVRLSPAGAAWLNLIAGWWRMFRRNALTGVSLADTSDTACATRIAIAQFICHARPQVWNRPISSHRRLLHCFVCRL